MFHTGVPKQDAQVALKGTTSGDKNELPFSRFNINYNDTPRRFRKGTTLYRARPDAVASPEPPRLLLQEASKGGVKKDAPRNGCVSAGNADGADNSEGSVPKGRANEKKPVVVASTNENKPVVALADDNKPVVVAPANENKPVVASADENKPVVVAPANENKPVVASSPAEDSTQDCLCVGSTPERQVGIQNAVGKGRVLDGEPGNGESQNALEKAKPLADEVVRVVTRGAGAVKLKRLLKKGHAPPGTIEEDACDLIRTDFWDRNPHILSGIARR